MCQRAIECCEGFFVRCVCGALLLLLLMLLLLLVVAVFSRRSSSAAVVQQLYRLCLGCR